MATQHFIHHLRGAARRFAARSVMVTAATLLAAGCDGPDPTQPAAEAYPSPSLAVIPTGLARRDARRPWPQEDHMRRVGARIPGGYGGHYLDDEGDLVVWVKNLTTAAAGAARAVLPDATRNLRVSGGVKVRVGDYTFDELVAYRDTLFGLFQESAVVALDVDETRNRIVVGIEAEAAMRAKERVAAFLVEHGIPPGAVVTEEYETVTEDPSASTASGAAGTLNGFHSMIVAGIQVVGDGVDGLGYQACSIGLVTTWGPSIPVLLTAAHCNDKWGIPDGMPYYQPTTQFVGNEYRDQVVWECDPGLRCLMADAVAIRILGEARTAGHHKLAKVTGMGSTTLDPSQPYYDVYWELPQSTVGMQVYKLGMKTGLTIGNVKDTCKHFRASSGSDRVVLCQDKADYDSDGGDSGGAVFTFNGSGQVVMAGMHRGRIGYWDRTFSPMSQIRIDLYGLERLWQ